jgi:alkylation response protein AidB-like acyl-CoA dehydrogenase
MLLARTDADVPKHAGLSYFIIDVRQPGVEIRPIREMTGRRFFNEVFLSDARVPVDDLVGGAGNGWAVANTTLAYERGFRATGGVPPRVDPGPIAGNLDRAAGDCATPLDDDKPGIPESITAEGLAALARELERSDEPVLRDDLTRLFILERLVTLTAGRGRAAAALGRDLPGLPQLTKILTSHLVRQSQHTTFSVLGARGTLFGYDDAARDEIQRSTGIPDLARLVETSVFAAAPPIYGGSDQIQRNILGERVLGLPREPGTDRKIPFKDLPRN